MPTVRHAASDCTVFSLGGTAMITALQNATIVSEVKDEDAAGVHDVWEYPWAVKGRWHIEADIFAESIAALMPLVGTVVTVTFTTGAGSYSGSVLVTMGSHQVNRDSLQVQKAMLKGQGAATIA